MGALLALALISVGILARQRGSLIRALALTVFLLALSNPSLVQEQRESVPNVVAAVIDRSTSQKLDGREAQTDAARTALEERFGSLEGVEVRWVEAPKSGDATDGTPLFAALQTALSDVTPDRVAGVVMVTDGRVHDIPATAPVPAPFHALITGKPDERDRKVTLTLSPRFGIVDKEQKLGFRIDETDTITPKQPVAVTIRRNGEEITRMSLMPGVETFYDMPIAHAGQNIVEIEAASVEGELSTVNNRAALTIEGIREKLRVLLVSGAPHAGERTWRNLLKSDAGVDLVHFTILRPPEKQDGTPINQLSLIAFPTRELFSTRIDDFDLIIFDRYNQQGILPMLYFDNIAQYVRKGGAMLIAAGSDYAAPGTVYETPLASVLSAEPSGNTLEKAFRPAITAAGQRHPVTRSLLASPDAAPQWSHWFRIVDTTVREGHTIMSGADDKPLLVLNRYDQGRVGILLSDQVWLWARNYEGGGPYVDLLRRLSHWLMKEPDLEEEALRLKAQGNTLTLERQTMAETTDPVTLTFPSEETRTVTLRETAPGLWGATLNVNEMGLYHARTGDLTALAHVGPANPREFRDITSTTQTLAALAEKTGGSVVRVTEGIPDVRLVENNARAQGNGWIGLERSTAYHVTGLDIYPAFSGLIGLGLLLGLLSVVWLRDR